MYMINVYKSQRKPSCFEQAALSGRSESGWKIEVSARARKRRPRLTFRISLSWNITGTPPLFNTFALPGQPLSLFRSVFVMSLFSLSCLAFWIQAPEAMMLSYIS
jgi:hypothetical protein